MKNTRSAYVNLIDNLCVKLGKAARRAVGELERMTATPAAVEMAENATSQFDAYIQETMGKVGIPVLGANTKLEDVPETGQAWVYQPLEGAENFSRGLAPVCSIFSLLKDRRPLFTAAYFPVEDIIIVAEAGEGASSSIRLRTGQNKEKSFSNKIVFVDDALLTAPLLTKILAEGGKVRVRSNTVQDVADVVAGRGLAAICQTQSLATRAFVYLMAKEAQAKASTLNGEPFNMESDAVVLSPLASHEEALSLLK